MTVTSGTTGDDPNECKPVGASQQPCCLLPPHPHRPIVRERIGGVGEFYSGSRCTLCSRDMAENVAQRQSADRHPHRRLTWVRNIRGGSRDQNRRKLVFCVLKRLE